MPTHGFDVAVDVAVFLAGSVLLLWLARRWREQLPLRWALGYLLLTASFFGGALATPALQVASDIPYRVRPWSVSVARGFAPANELLSDVPLFFLPLNALARESLLRLEAPLWAHQLGTGQPLLGNGNTPSFAPLHLLALPLPTARALTVAVAWQTLVALLLTHLLLRRLGAGQGGASVAAVAYAFSSFAVAWAYHPQAMVAAWLPGLLLGVLHTAGGTRDALALILFSGVAMAASGHPETLAHGAIVAAALAAVLWVRRPEVGRRRFLARLALAGLLIAGLTAPVLLPFLETLPHSERLAVVERTPGAVWPPPFALAHLLPVVEPLAFGSPRDGNWNGPWNFNELCSVYAGLVALALAVAGAVTQRGRVLAVLAAGVVALGGALALPPFFQAWRFLPLLEHAAHGRLRLLWILAVAVAAGLSVEPLARRQGGALAAAVALAGAALGVALLPPPGEGWQELWHRVTVLATAATAAVVALPRTRPWLATTALAAVVLDLWLLGVRYHPALPPDLDLEPPPALAALAAASVATGEPSRVLAFGRDLHPNLAAYYGLWDARAHDCMHPVRASGFVGRRLFPRHRPGRSFLFAEKQLDQPLLDFLAVRHLLVRPRLQLPPPWQPEPPLAGGRVWHNPQALGVFYLPARAEGVRTPEQALDLALANHDFRQSAAVLDPDGSAPTGAQNGRVERVRARANGFDLEVVTATGGIVASSVSALPGWRATAAGQDLRVVETNSAFLGVMVPPGRTLVRLDYQPAGWRWGLRACVATLLGLGGYAMAAARQRRRRRRRHG